MIYSVNISSQADKDIRAIYEYIALSLMSPENADAQLSRLEERINNLNNLPKRFPKYKNDIRFMPVDNYLVFYSVDDLLCCDCCLSQLDKKLTGVIILHSAICYAILKEKLCKYP